MWEKVADPKGRSDEGCWKKCDEGRVAMPATAVRNRRHSVQHPPSVLALRANPPSPTRGEGRAQPQPRLNTATPHGSSNSLPSSSDFPSVHWPISIGSGP
ncbi:hypothetical protein D3Y55_02455 [Mesorhizobium sp. DCY119]|nr:hypothetical protein D3Y55_02455 [Mesorhizobium sp. DCY119]